MVDTTLKLILLGEDKSAGDTVGKVGKVAGLAFAAAGAAALKFGADSLEAFAEADAQQKKLEYAYARFPALAGGNIDSLRKLNEEIQRKVGADADDIAGAQAVLAQYELNESQLQRMTPLLVDYATKTGKDMPTAAGILGKALMGNARALKDLGIDFKATGDRGADFDAIVGHLDAKVGGYAESIPDAERKQKILAASFGDLQEAVGEQLQPIMIEATEALQNLTDMAATSGNVFGPLIDITLGLATAVNDLTGALAEGGDLQWVSDLKGLIDMGTGIGGVAMLFRDYRDAHEEAAEAVEGTADASRQLRDESRDAGTAIATTTGELDDNTTAAEENADAQRDAAAALMEVYRNQLAVRGDTRALEAAYDDATAAVKKNGRTLDDNTAKGRANQEALDRIASSALQVKSGMEKAGKSTQDINSEMERARTKFIETAQQMGASKDEARQLADQLGLVKSPKVDTSEAQGNLANLAKKADDAADAVRDIPSRKNVDVVVKVGGDKGIKTVYSAGGGVKFSAYDKGGRPKVGELAMFHADELWVPDTAGTVLTKSQTQRLIGEGPDPLGAPAPAVVVAAPAPTPVHLTLTGDLLGQGRQIVDALRAVSRATGGRGVLIE